MISFSIIVLRLVLALVLGGLIGLEREVSEHQAGMRTNALVSFGSALFTLISAYGFLSLSQFTHVQIDPTRIASYIVAGIGFLGGGAIFLRKESVKGLTTAAAIWTVAAIGMACAVGFYWESVVATLLTLIILRVLVLVENRMIPEHSQITVHVHFSADAPLSLIEEIHEMCINQGLLVETLRIRKNTGENELNLECRTLDTNKAASVVQTICTLPGVQEAKLEVREPGRLARRKRKGTRS